MDLVQYKQIKFILEQEYMVHILQSIPLATSGANASAGLVLN